MIEALDEMVDGNGGTRPAWRGIVEPLLALGPGQIGNRARLLRRAGSEEAAGWRCDPIPLPLPASEFDRLARGLAQRATLIEHLLADVYGAQSLLAEGRLAPSLVFGSPHFVRAARIEGGRGGRRLLDLYAADLRRGPDGNWRVVADRCAKPSGIAAALENRRLLRRVVPELFRPGIRGLDGFFERWRDRLRALAPGDAGIALLTDGRGSFGASEPVLLARELGAHLVRGADLTLRDGRLHVKTLRGLRRIDLLVNRQPARLLDPLELDWDNGAGVPGMMSAMRAGRLAIVNDPGAGLAGDPGIAACLAGLAPHVLGEPLALPSEDMHWMGDPAMRAAVRDDPDAWSFRSSRSTENAPVAFARLSRAGQARLLAFLEASPAELVAVRPVPPSVMPAVVDERLEPVPITLRMFLVREEDGWTAMPGGLVRSDGRGRREEGGPEEGSRTMLAKDLFVIADGESEAPIWLQPPLPLGRRPPALAIRRLEADLPARVAEAFFRLGHALERLERHARRVRALAEKLGRFMQRPSELVELRIVAASLLGAKLLPSELLIDPAAPGLAEAVARLAEQRSPLAAAAAEIGRQAEDLGDRLTGEMLSVLSLAVADVRLAFVPGRGTLDAVAHVTGRILGLSAVAAGLAAESMVRSGAWMFLDTGMRLARAESVCSLLAAALGPAAALPRLGSPGTPDIEAGLRVLLELRDAAITYRARYGTRLEPGAALDLLVADAGNPRGLVFQLEAARTQLGRLSELGGAALVADASRLVEQANAMVAGVIAAADPEAAAAALPGAAQALLAEIRAVRRAIARRYLDLLPEMRTVAT